MKNEDVLEYLRRHDDAIWSSARRDFGAVRISTRMMMNQTSFADGSWSEPLHMWTSAMLHDGAYFLHTTRFPTATRSGVSCDCISQ